MSLPVIIAGAGPSGLTLAVELSRRNIPFRIFDKAAGPAPMEESRALAFNPRSQLILQESGATKMIRRAGHSIERARFLWNSKLLGEVATHLPSLPDQKIISIRQGDVERILLNVLAGMGTAPQWETELTGFEETTQGIQATLSAKGKSSVLEGRCLVGCDGAHSLTRKLGGYTFEGESDPQIWEMADILLPDARHAHMISADFIPGGANATIAISDRQVRIIRAGQDDIDRHPLFSQAEKVLWTSRFTVSYRMVKTFSRGKTFLCGDAAHIHSPVGGRGMNLGIEDAATLAFLMSNGREQEYSAQRLPVARKVLGFTHTQTRQLLSKSPVNHWIKQHLLRYLITFGPIRRKILQAVLAQDTPKPEWLR